MNDTNVRIELKGLEQILKALKTKAPTVKLGVLGKSSRSGSKRTTNAIVGAVHEFGAPGRNIPQRSFLRVPLIEHLNKEVEKAGLLDKQFIQEVIRKGSISPWIDKVAVVAMGIVMEAFETSGFGRWPAWKDPEYTNEGGMLLVDSGQLRDSITYEVHV